MRAESERELRDTRKRTDVLITAMRRSEKRIDPVLQPLRDRVLFLKHNLNAKSLGALSKELSSVEGSVDSLVADLQQSIAEADSFLAEMEREQQASGKPASARMIHEREALVNHAPETGNQWPTASTRRWRALLRANPERRPEPQAEVEAQRANYSGLGE